MIIERREFLDMLIEIEGSHSTLGKEFKTALIGIKRFSAQLRDAERLDVDDVRRLATDIHSAAERLDQKVEEMLDPEAADGSRVDVAQKVPAAEGAVVAARGTY